MDITDISCPYKKRRKIELLRTIDSNDINIVLYRAISNYHGISNLDSYAYQILNELYNCYSYKDYTVLVYNIRKSGPIKPRELSSLIHGNTECLCSIMPEEGISTKMSLHSAGDAIYMLKNIYELGKENWAVILGLLVLLGGGSALSFKVPGLIDIVKKVLSTPAELRAQKLENESKEIDNQLKRIELHQKIKESGINPESLIGPLEELVESTASLQTEPIILGDEASILVHPENENEESSETEDE